MRRPPISLIVMTLAGAALGMWMTVEGMHGRILGVYPSIDRLWLRVPDILGINPLYLAWPLVVLGTAWFGALCGLWIKSSWGHKAVLIVGLLSLFYLGPGTILGLVALICLHLPATRKWIETVEDANDD